ncbi:hypothetical protein ACTXT7_011936 [Hymenolepis weldensis]
MDISSTSRAIQAVIMQSMGMNAYLYAPKDEAKHRISWRQTYNEKEVESMKSLITAARDHNICFIFAISPGNDIAFSDAADAKALQARLEQHSCLKLCDHNDLQIPLKLKKIFPIPLSFSTGVVHEYSRMHHGASPAGNSNSLTLFTYQCGWRSALWVHTNEHRTPDL